MNYYRRKYMKMIGAGTIALPFTSLTGSIFTGCSSPTNQQQESSGDVSSLFFSISLAQWSLHNSFQGSLNPLDFPSIARNTYGIDAIEYVNTFYFNKAENPEYLSALKQRCADEGVKSLLIMCDAEGNLGDIIASERKQAVENHYKWVDAAAFLGCHSIRVNAAGNGTAEEVADAAVDGLSRLSIYAMESGINVIVENHGGYSSNGTWLAGVLSQVGMGNCGSLPDFGNFCIKRGEDGCEESYDRYQGVKELMPYAKGVSAKTNDFDENGDEVNIDYKKMLEIVKSAGFTGYIGIEYEGNSLSEHEGILATKRLLEKVGKAI